MKKSRIIIPALAMIALSTVASVTGTVAWFTATRQVTVTAGNFALTKTSANLACSVTGDIGTNGSNQAVTVKDNYLLGHGSFDHIEKYVMVPNTVASDVSEVALASATEGNVQQSTEGTGASAKKVLTVFTWNMTFTMTFSSTGRDTAIYLDKAASSLALASNGDPVSHTGKAFRIAFIPSTSETATGVTKVWAPAQGGDDGATPTPLDNVRHVAHVASGTHNMNGTAYTSTYLMDKDSTATVPADEALSPTAAAGQDNYFGTLNFTANSTATLTFKCVAWFEGTDPNILPTTTASELETVSATMSFEARTLGNA